VKIQLFLDAIPVAETEIDTSSGDVFEKLQVLNDLGIWDFRLKPTDLALEPVELYDARGLHVTCVPARPYYYESTMINVRLIP
jgi:hypothetical protein